MECPTLSMQPPVHNEECSSWAEDLGPCSICCSIGCTNGAITPTAAAAKAELQLTTQPLPHQAKTSLRAAPTECTTTGYWTAPHRCSPEDHGHQTVPEAVRRFPPEEGCC